MEFGFLNLAMLAGLIGIGLPVIAHLLSKRRYVVVDWGAMRFLQLGQRTRRRIHLQDYILLLLRMGLIACLVIGLSRPWGSGQLLRAFGSSVQQDLVLIIDGSGSLSWQGETNTLHQQAVQMAHQALESIRPGDTVSLIDARKVPRRLLTGPSGDLTRVREALNRIPPPSGISSLTLAIEDAMKLLTTTSNPLRRVVVLTDNQALPWNLNDQLGWERIEDLKKQFKEIPAIRVVPVGLTDQSRQNFSVSRLSLSKEITVPEFPVKIRASIRQSGGSAPVLKTAYLEVDGQRVQGKSVDLTLPPDGEGTIEFDYVFPVSGEYVVSVVIDPDRLPVDDRSDGVVTISPGLPVLLVDGDPRLDATKSESFYLKSAFASSDSKSPWINAKTIPADQLQSLSLNGMKVVFLLNVKQLTARQWSALQTFVREGGGLVIAPGDRVDAESWNQLDRDDENRLLPMQFGAVQRAADDATSMFDSDSLHALWLQRFRRDQGVDFLQSRFGVWWSLKAVRQEEKSSGELHVLARQSNREPFLVSKRYGQGEVIQLAFPLDADWSTLPAKGDFVPFAYELTFQLAGHQAQRNVETGMPLQFSLPFNSQADYVVSVPGGGSEPAILVQKGIAPFAVYRNTTVPGLYRFSRVGERGLSHPFVVNDDRAESDLSPLTQAELKTLHEQYGLSQTNTLNESLSNTSVPLPQIEFWWFLLIAVMLLLVAEAALTRRMVHGGHHMAEA